MCYQQTSAAEVKAQMQLYPPHWRLPASVAGSGAAKSYWKLFYFPPLNKRKSEHISEFVPILTALHSSSNMSVKMEQTNCDHWASLL